MIVCLVTDRRRLCRTTDEDAWPRCLTTQVHAAIEAGIDLVQVREPDLPARTLVDLVRGFVASAKGSATRVVVNDRLDVAIAARADGVHLRGDSMRARDARRLAPGSFLIGQSVRNVVQARDASDADYLIAGTLWPTTSKLPGHPLLGPEGLRAIVEAATVPVLAIGGITIARAADVARGGGAGVAAIGLFMDEDAAHTCRAVPLRGTVDRLRASFDTAATGS